MLRDGDSGARAGVLGVKGWGENFLLFRRTLIFESNYVLLRKFFYLQDLNKRLKIRLLQPFGASACSHLLDILKFSPVSSPTQKIRLIARVILLLERHILPVC